MDNLAHALNSAGHEATVHSWIERKGIQKKAIEDYRSGRLSGPIGLVGHSLGGNSANFMANDLTSAKVDVAYIATIDPTEPKPNPNGIQADNFRSRDFRAERVKGATDFFFPELSHTEVDKDARVHRRIKHQCSEAQTVDPSPNHQPQNAIPDDLANLTNEEILKLIMHIIGRIAK